jgi:hypothetical protein
MLPGIDWPDCEVKHKRKELRPPKAGKTEPTKSPAGSLARIEEYARRASQGLRIFNRRDSRRMASKRQEREATEHCNASEKQRVIEARAERAAKKAAKEKSKSEHQLFNTGRKRGGQIVKPSQPRSGKDGHHPDDTKAATVSESGTESKDAAIGSGR